MRAIRLVTLTAVITLVSAVGLWVVVRALFSGPSQQNRLGIATVASAPANSTPAMTPDTAGTTAIPNPRRPSLLTELRGSLAKRREYDLWLIRGASIVMNGNSKQEKALLYCMFTVSGAERSLDSAPETEYQLQPDGNVLITSGKPPKTPEERFRDGQRMQLEFETGGGPTVQDCAGSIYSFGTWHDQPMPTDDKFAGITEKAEADIEEIDKMLDSRLVEALPKPVTTGPVTRAQ
jgi:hypothetical protein